MFKFFKQKISQLLPGVRRKTNLKYDKEIRYLSLYEDVQTQNIETCTIHSRFYLHHVEC